MKKRWIPVIAGLMLALLPAGCGKTDASEPGAKSVAEEVPAAVADEGTAAEAAKEEAAYNPAAFQVSDVCTASEQKATTDITGCDTFTQIVDKLEAGRGYANATIGDTDVLLVSSGTYEWEPGSQAAIDAEIFYYNDGVPTYLTTVSAGGTAYPLAVKNGNLYVGGNHFMTKFLVDGGYLIETEEAYVQYDTDGKAAYYYKTCNSQFEDYDAATAESRFTELFAEQEDAEVILFQPVGGVTSSLESFPVYGYPGPELL